MREYKPIIDSVDRAFLVKGYVDGRPQYDPDPPYWLELKIKPDPKFCGESEIFTQKSVIEKLIEELKLLDKRNKGHCGIKCVGWGSYINFTITNPGDLTISGQINKRWNEEDIYLKFKFTSDSSAISRLIAVLGELITN